MISEPLQQQMKRISQRFLPIDKVLLFGSRAYGDHEERSDVDLAVIAPGMQEKEWLDYAEALEEELDTLLKIDLIWWETAPEKLKVQIDKCHFVLYVRN